MMSDLPADFTRTTTEVHGEAGTDWLKHLPGLLAECADRWSLTVGPPFVPLSYNYLAPAIRADGTPVVLKMGVPSPELDAESAALRLYDGNGAARLLEADPDAGVMLLERLTPGLSLVTVADDTTATTIAAEMMQQLWCLAPDEHQFPTVADWALGFERLRLRFNGRTGPLPQTLVEEAEATCTDLLSSSSDHVLLHGDLHHGNVLSAVRAPWLAIDPKGMIGEPAFEPSAFLLNPCFLSEDILKRRIEIFADVLGLSKDRIRGWCLVRAMLSAWWSLEDHGAGWENAVAVAKALRAT